MPYLVKLDQFEGPLDLLLHLVGKAKIDLQDIFVSKITDQYLIYMEQIEEIDMDRASDFLNMAATLLYIKSRSLLPNKREAEEGEEGYVDPETELINRLRAYKLYKDAGGVLTKMEEAAKDTFYKLPEELFEGEQEIVIEDASADALYLAFLSVLKNRKPDRSIEDSQVEIHHDTFSIRHQKSKILLLLKDKKKASFFSIFEGSVTQMEVAVTFVALLELWHMGRIRVSQKSYFKDIMLEYCVGDNT